MAKLHWKGSALLAPVPPVLVSVGTKEAANLITIGWTGILATHPATAYISVRPERHSYQMLLEGGEFVIHLPTEEMVRAVDFCGMYTGAKVDKFKRCHFTKEPAETVACPLIAEAPISLECKVKERIPLGTHDMFLAEITGVNVDEALLDENGKLCLFRARLLAYAHGEYFALGKKLGEFGFSARKHPKKKAPPPQSKKQSSKKRQGV